MGVGLLGFIGVGVESSGGTSSTSGQSTMAEFTPFITETLAVTKDTIDDESIRALWDNQRVFNGQQRVGGTVTMKVIPSAIGHFFHSWFDTSTTITGSSQLVTSNANWAAHRFVAAQGQFQSGSGSDVPTKSFLVYRGPAQYQQAAPSSAFFYYNCAANVMELTAEAGQLVRASFDFVGRDYARIAMATPTFPTPQGFLWSSVSLAIAGAGTPIYQSLTIRGDNKLEGIAKLDGRLRPDLTKRNGFREIQVNGRLTYQNDTDYDRFVQGSEQTLQLYFSTEGGSFELLIDTPRFRYSTFPLGIGGPGFLSVDFTGRAVYDHGSGSAMTITLVNTRLSAYAVNAAV